MLYGDESEDGDHFVAELLPWGLGEGGLAGPSENRFVRGWLLTT